MKPENESESEGSLQTVRDAFEQWRTTRKKRDRIPESLWKAAMDLSPCYSTFRIAKVLRLDYNEVKRRILDRSSRSTTSEFVELNVEHILPAARFVVEVRSPGGFEFKIETGAAFPSQLTDLISCFLRESR